MKIVKIQVRRSQNEVELSIDKRIVFMAEHCIVCVLYVTVK